MGNKKIINYNTTNRKTSCIELRAVVNKRSSLGVEGDSKVLVCGQKCECLAVWGRVGDNS